ncbi:MAG TPA: hypothetical protein VFO65_07800 [Acidimicrobiales bacterium]|nr:hypothetical protein [Acidimicrobiales bacterium]
MTNPLDVLLVEAHPGLGAAEARELERAGHRVHRCHEDGAVPGPGAGFGDHHLCRAVTTGDCPLDGHVDVALVVRRSWRPAFRPTVGEAGVSCALRAGVPLVEDGPALFDPFTPWLTGRVAGDPVGACEAAAAAGLATLGQDIHLRIERLLGAAGIPPQAVACRFDRGWPRPHVVLVGPPVTIELRQALAVRVLDAVRAAGRTYGDVAVSYDVTCVAEEALHG